jgi:hypothetical protein
LTKQLEASRTITQAIEAKAQQALLRARATLARN